MQLAHEPSPVRPLPILFRALSLFSGRDVCNALTTGIFHVPCGGLHLGEFALALRFAILVGFAVGAVVVVVDYGRGAIAGSVSALIVVALGVMVVVATVVAGASFIVIASIMVW